MQEEERPLLTRNIEELKVYTKIFKQGDPYSVLKIYEEEIKISGNGKEHVLPVRDLIGFHNEQMNGDIHKIKISSFPKRKPWFGKQKRVVEHLQLYCQISNKQLKSLELQLINKITNRQLKDPSELKFIVYFNPVAGANSKQKLNYLLQFVKHTNVQLEVITTQGRDYCKEHLNKLDPRAYQTVLIISGDGLMHEFVNSNKCGILPVSHIPGGSGNGFAKSVTADAGEDCSTEVATFLALKGRTKPYNIWKMELQNIAEPIYSFLSLQWALLADIDLNSQFLRCLGGFRFEVYATYRLLNMIRYPGKLTYSFHETHLPSINQPINDNNFQVIQGDFLQAAFVYIPFLTEKFQFAPLLHSEDKAMDMQIVLGEHGRWSLIKYFLNVDSGASFDKEKGGLKEGVNFGWGKIKSYRLEPQGQGFVKGVLAIDGQSYEAQKIQATLSERKLITFV